jgi:hypothetical protein
MTVVYDIERVEVDQSLQDLQSDLFAIGYVTYLAPTDAQVIAEADEFSFIRCGCGGRVFPVGFRRDDTSYRAFAICASCDRVVEEL